ncbi:alpha-N-arabinofuranosidase [Marivirga lumbricoides]|uniref:non-reducing end alpha-L-arabinofuranosidase n=1 Tax=Marivirga lumbricoides TaxID=1046115 RepID=A0ABQ1N574_9BACT|nr:alpha-N-arabinofuranosidase [Marivirga lumbricoides]
MKKTIILILSLTFTLSLFGQKKATNVEINAQNVKDTISRHIYGHFAEHLGRGVYDGIYVGESAKIPTTYGVRNDIIEALKELKIPNLRWPGGCFADTYHWKDAIGPKEDRKAIENMSWGGYREDNSFGTHEFLNLCESLGAEPYLAVNMNSGSVAEAVDWKQYVNHKNGSSYLTDLRKENGREKPWNVKYWGIGNESWGCGGEMTVDYYVNLYKRYAIAMAGNDMYRIAVGPGEPDYNWTEVLMKEIPLRLMEGISVHHYSVIDWSEKGSSTAFSTDEYFQTMAKAWFMEEFITKNSEIMDQYDPEKKVALIVDEWGGWYETDPEGNGALYQQNTMRDAMIAGVTLNVFNNHADRVKMANLAQTVNVLQAIILTEGQKMLLTPTYHVMEMYKVHQDAALLPIEMNSDAMYSRGDKEIPALSVSASKDKAGVTHVSIVNIHDSESQEVNFMLADLKGKSVSAEILQSEKLQDLNDFDNPDKVAPKVFKGFKSRQGQINMNIPPFSVVVFEIK